MSTNKRTVDLRGNSEDRRRRRQWLLQEFGDGTTALCAFGCGAVLDEGSVTADRYPVPGVDGGRYVKGNIRPACSFCNSQDGAEIARRLKAERQ